MKQQSLIQLGFIAGNLMMSAGVGGLVHYEHFGFAAAISLFIILGEFDRLQRNR